MVIEILNVGSQGFHFPKRVRLLKPAEFKRVFEKPVKQNKGFFSVYARINDLDHPRLGLAIPKKAVRKAVHRNRLKRIFRERFRCDQARLTGFDIVILVQTKYDQVLENQILLRLEDVWTHLAKLRAK